MGKRYIFLSADWRLVEVARRVEINAFDVEKEGEKFKTFIES